MSGSTTPNHPVGFWGALRHLFCGILSALVNLLQFFRALLIIFLIKLGCKLTWPLPVKPGGTLPPRNTNTENLTSRFRDVMSPSGEASAVIWQLADSEVLFYPRETQIKITAGLVLVGLSLESDESGQSVVTVPFAVGSDDNLAGMLAVTEEQPRGPDMLVELWGEAIIATAWNALLEIVQDIASEAGRDENGDLLRAGALVARQDKLIVIPQAMHEFESRLEPSLESRTDEFQVNLQ